MKLFILNGFIFLYAKRMSMDKSRIQRQYMEPMVPFKLKAPFQPTGDQPNAVKSLVEGLNEGQWAQVLLGATGTGKTFTMAKVIEEVQRPTLIISPNKTLAAQTASEFKDFFPDNAVYYFVSYYDYYQPESYVPQTDTYIEKDSSRNEEIDRLRHSATMALFERKDVIIVASVSCIYGLGDPEDYSTMGLSLRPGEEIDRDTIIEKLVNMQYMRNDMNFTRDTFRVRGDTIDVFPASEIMWPCGLKCSAMRWTHSPSLMCSPEKRWRNETTSAYFLLPIMLPAPINCGGLWAPLRRNCREG